MGQRTNPVYGTEEPRDPGRQTGRRASRRNTARDYNPVYGTEEPTQVTPPRPRTNYSVYDNQPGAYGGQGFSYGGYQQNPYGNAYVPGTLVDLDPRLEEQRKAALRAGIDAIGADFNLQGAELDAQKRSLENEFNMGMKASRVGQREAVQGVQTDMVNRGLMRSGITLTETAKAVQPYATQRADLISRINPVEGALGSEQVAIQNKRNLLVDAQTAAEAQMRIGSEREKLDLELMRQLAAVGLGG